MLPQEKPQEQDEQQAPEENQQPSSAKPEYVPDDLWDNEAQQVKVDALLERYKDTQTTLRNRTEELREEIRKELTGDGAPEKYELDLPDGTLPEGVRLNLEGDETVESFTRWAKDKGLSQEDFTTMLSLHAKAVASQVPDQQAEMAKLGDKAEQRIQDVARYASRHLDEQEYDQFRGMAVTAEQIKILEKLIHGKRNQGPTQFDQFGGTTGEVAQEEIDKLMRSDAYWKQDPSTLAKVDRLVKLVAKRRR